MNGARQTTTARCIQPCQWAYWGALLSLLALIVLNLSWELWLAPLRPGGSLMALKAILLLLPLRGILKQHRYTFQWSGMLILSFLAEGLMRGWSDQRLSQALAWIEAGLSLIFFSSALLFISKTTEAYPKV